MLLVCFFCFILLWCLLTATSKINCLIFQLLFPFPFRNSNLAIWILNSLEYLTVGAGNTCSIVPFGVVCVPAAAMIIRSSFVFIQREITLLFLIRKMAKLHFSKNEEVGCGIGAFHATSSFPGVTELPGGKNCKHQTLLGHFGDRIVQFWKVSAQAVRI